MLGCRISIKLKVTCLVCQPLLVDGDVLINRFLHAQFDRCINFEQYYFNYVSTNVQLSSEPRSVRRNEAK